MVFHDIDEKKSVTFNKRDKLLVTKLNKNFPIASPLDRLAAHIVDALIFFPVTRMLLAPLTKQYNIESLIGSNSSILINFSLLFILYSLGFILYHSLFIYFFGATPGKRFFGLRVICIWNGEKPKFLASILRSMTWLFGSLLIFIPHLAVMTNLRRRPIHDRISDTIVISPNQKGVNNPSFFEKLFIKSFSIGVLGLALGLIINFNSIEYQDIENLVDTSPREIELCSGLNEKVKNLNLPKKTSLISQVMVLFALDKIDESCLTSVAHKSFHQPDVAYLALALSYSQDETLYKEYLNKACEGHALKEGCKMSKILQLWEEEKWTESDALLETLTQNGSLYIKIWAIRHFIEMGRNEKSLELLTHIPSTPFFSEFIAENRAKALWATHRYSEATSVIETIISSLESESKLDLAYWLCEKTVSSKCEAYSKITCEILDTTVRETPLLLAEPTYALTWIKYQLCSHKENPNFSEIINSMILPGAKDFVKAIELSKSNHLLEARKIFKQLTNDQIESLSIEAKIQFINLSENFSEISDLFHSWLKNENKNNFKIGEMLFKKTKEFGHHKEALTIGLALKRSDPNNVELRQDLVVLFYKTGDKQNAFNLWKEMSSERSPANDSEFQNVINLLKNESIKL